MVAVSGVFRALSELGGILALRRLFDTGFGWSLIAKIVLFGALLAPLGARNRYVNVPGLQMKKRRQRAMTGLRRTVRAEIAVAAVILVVTAILSQLPPPALRPAAAIPRPSSGQALTTGEDLVEQGRDPARDPDRLSLSGIRPSRPRLGDVTAPGRSYKYAK